MQCAFNHNNMGRIAASMLYMCGYIHSDPPVTEASPNFVARAVNLSERGKMRLQ